MFKLVIMFFEKERKKQSIYRKADFILLFCANVILFIADHFSKSCKAKLRTLTVHDVLPSLKIRKLMIYFLSH